MSGILQHIDITADEVDCYGHWRGPRRQYRAHLVVEHCNVDSCSNVASTTVSFGFFTNRGRRQVGVPMGVCPEHEWLLDANRISVQVSPYDAGNRIVLDRP